MKKSLLPIPIAIIVLFIFPANGISGKFRNGNWKHPDKKEKSAKIERDAIDNSLAARSNNKGRITGKIVFETEQGDIEPMMDCKLCFFDEKEGPAPKQDSLWWRIPDHESDININYQGSFDVSVPEGEYIVASVERLTPGEDFGPPFKGEKVFISKKVSIKANKKTDLGVGKSKKHTKEQLTGNKYSGDRTAKVEGLLVGPDGKPFKGGFVVAYPYGFLSKRTKADGKFTLYLPEGGDYSLVARNVYGFT